MHNSIDIIILVYNNYSITRECIEAVFRNTVHPYRLVIVNDASTDEDLIRYLKRLKEQKRNILLINNKNNLGRTKSVNKGIMVSRSEILVIIDNDTIVSHSWLLKIKKGFDYAPEIGIIGPRFNNSTSPAQNVKFMPSNSSRDKLESEIRKINDSLKNSEKNQFIGTTFIFGACMVFRRKVFKNCGYFDELFSETGAGYFDDIDMCFRAIKAGFDVGVCKKTFIYHHKGKSYKDPNTRRNDIGRGFRLFALKWSKDKLFKYIPEEMKISARHKSITYSKNGYIFKKNKVSFAPKSYLLINPPVEDTIEYRVFSKYAYPVGLLRIAHYLLDKGHKINFIDFNPSHSRAKFSRRIKCGDGRLKNLYYYGASYKKFKEKINLIPEVDEVFITTVMTYHYGRTLKKIVDILQNKFPKIKIKVGGVYASLCHNEIEKIEGVEVHPGPYESADKYFPLVELLNYKPRGGILRLIKGCPHRCSYCAVTLLERKVQKFGLKRLINEFHYYLKNNITDFSFWDSNLLLAKRDFSRFLDYLSQYGYSALVSLDLSYGFEPGLLDDEIIERLKKVKIKDNILLPLESAVTRLFNIRFHKSKNHVEKVIRLAEKVENRLKKQCSFYVLAGLPDQSLDDILYTIYFGLIRRWWPSIMLFTPIPGTEEFKRYYHLIKDKTTEELNPNLFPFARKELSSEDLQNILRFFHESFLDYDKEKGVIIKKYNINRTRIIHNKMVNRGSNLLKFIRNLTYKERIDPALDSVPFYGKVVMEHVKRYNFANRFVRGKVLDLGCGTGYGLSKLDQKLFSSAIGIDISKEVIDFAKIHYSGARTNFLCCDIFAYDAFEHYDTILAFEVIEHLSPDLATSFLAKINQLMDKNSICLISTYLNNRKDRLIPLNPFHKREYSHDEFKRMLSKFFNIEVFGQKNTTFEPYRHKGNYSTILAACKKL